MKKSIPLPSGGSASAACKGGAPLDRSLRHAYRVFNGSADIRKPLLSGRFFKRSRMRVHAWRGYVRRWTADSNFALNCTIAASLQQTPALFTNAVDLFRLFPYGGRNNGILFFHAKMFGDLFRQRWRAATFPTGEGFKGSPHPLKALPQGFPYGEAVRVSGLKRSSPGVFGQKSKIWPKLKTLFTLQTPHSLQHTLSAFALFRGVNPALFCSIPRPAAM